MHGGHVGKLSSTWRAPEWTKWTSKLGLLRAESDIGSKTKFFHLSMLYISYLSCQVIRALDQRIISVQLASVNALTAITKLQKSMVKTRSNECSPFAHSSSQCMLQLLFWGQVKLLKEIQRTRNANVDDESTMNSRLRKILSTENSCRFNV